MNYGNEYIKNYFQFYPKPKNDNTLRSSFYVLDKTIALNPYDRYKYDIEDTIRKIKYFNKLIIGNLNNINDVIKEYNLKIRKIIIIKILKNNNGDYDVYVKINYVDDEEDNYHWGVIKNILSINPQFKSDILTNVIRDKNITSKICGGIVKTILEWLTPKPGYYEILCDYISCFDLLTGKHCKIYCGEIIKIIKSDIRKQKIIYKNKEYKLDTDSTIYFNWWFKKINI